MNEYTNIIRHFKNEEKSFEEERDHLESSYQVNCYIIQEIIELKIKQEREHHKEFLKKKPVKDYRSRSNSEGKNDEDETIRDRTPILDLLIDKFNYFITEKRRILERHQKNTIILKESLDILIDLLGLNEYTEIPFVLEKMEMQHAEIEIYSSKLKDDLMKLETEKERIHENIESLKAYFYIKQNQNMQNISLRSNFYNDKSSTISELTETIKIL